MKFTAVHIFLLLLLLTGFQENLLLAQKGQKFSKVKKEEKSQLAEYAFSEGMKQYILGNLAGAHSNFEESQKLGGDNAALNYMMAKIYVHRNKPDIALQYASKAIKLDDKNPYYYLLAAEIYERKQDYSEALKIYKKLLAEVPNSEEYNYNLAEIYYFQKNYDDALKIYHKIELEFGKSLPLSERKKDIYIRTNRLEQAIQEGESLIKTFPDVPEYKVSHAEFLYKNKMPEKAIALLEQVIKEHPEDSYAHILLSDIYQGQGDREKSDKELESVFNNPETDLNAKINIIGGYLMAKETPYNIAKALSLGEAIVKAHPSESKAHMVYGETLLKAGKKEEALNSFIHAKELDGTNYNLWLQIVALDTELNKHDSLIVHTEEALETFPNQGVLWLYNGIGYAAKKKYAKAVEVLEEGKKLSLGDSKLLLEFNTQLADNYHNVKEYKKSDAAFEEILKEYPHNDHALNNYSYYLSLRKEKLELAKTMSGKLTQKYPDEPTYLDTYAWVLYQMKNFEEAKKYLEIAVQRSENGTILEHYADTLYQLGQKEQAVESWKKAKKLGETSDFIDKKIEEKKLYE